jgi:Zn-dependent protease/CBS domain-containing protein
MQNGWRVGTLFNIPFFIDPSCLFIIAVYTLSDGLSGQEQLGAPLAYGLGLAMAILLFTSILLHELGHSLVAQSQGIKVNSITLFLFGGMAAIDSEPKTPGKMFQVAIAGPLVSFGIFAALSLLVPFISLPNPLLSEVCKVLLLEIARLNLVLTLFNLIPGLPLDGGQVLKAAVWKRTGSQIKGSLFAAKAGRGFGWGISAFGLAALLGITRQLGLPGGGTGIWALFIGSFMVRNADRYRQVAELQQTLLGLKASDVMTREFRTLDANWTLRQFADHAVVSVEEPTAYFAASDGRYRGRVALKDLQLIERSLWEQQTLTTIAQPLTEIPSVKESTPLSQVIQTLEIQQEREITVLSPAGAVAGMIDRGDICRTIAGKMGFAISDETVRQIKESGEYPPGLQLASIAQATEDSPA